MTQREITPVNPVTPVQKTQVGDVFVYNSHLYMICRCGYNEVILVALDDGNWWNDPHNVKEDMDITEDEFNEIIGRNNRASDFERISKIKIQYEV